MPVSSFGVAVPTAPIGEAGVVSLRIEGIEFNAVKEFVSTANFLTPSDAFRMTLAHDKLSDDARRVLRAGSRCELFIDDVPQFSGYIDKFTYDVDRGSGTVMQIEGRDAMSPVVDSQIDPDHHYPDKTPLGELLEDILLQFGFEEVIYTNEANVLVSANLALKQKRGGSKKKRSRRRKHASSKAAAHQYPLPKSKPEHNDTYFQFLSRILNRQGLWMWPSVDGKQVIIGVPNYDQEPLGQLRRIVGGLNNNILSGGIHVDTTGQPSFIFARGNIPPTAREHKRFTVVIDHTIAQLAFPSVSYADAFRTTDGETTVTNVPGVLSLGGPVHLDPPAEKKSLATQAFKYSRSQGGRPEAEGKGLGALREETGTFSEAQAKASPIYVKMFTDVVKIPAKPIQLPNLFASTQSRPMFLKDKNSRTLPELERFARRQMSLFARRAFVANYTFHGFYLDGAIPQPDTMVSIVDEPASFEGNLWVLSRTVRQSRSGGTTTSLELLVPGALQF